MNFMGRAVIAGLGLIVAAMPLHAFAFDNEPDGFRGLAWGTPVATVADEFSLVSSDGKETYYTRKGDKMEMEDADLKSIVYRFYDGRFFGVAIYAARGSRYDFLQAFHSRYGPGAQPDRHIDKYYWAGDTAEIILDCKKIIDDCYAVIRSAEAAREEKAEDAHAMTDD